jgi:hypothetical protein
MLFVIFIFKALGFSLVGLGLAFTFLSPFNGHQVFSNIFLVVVMYSPSST